ncbi:hypothetical protein SAMN05444417_2120 [Wenxinia saemankumensis]|uniref:DUF2332 domain-containing protein n=2 Tax=Wenxinia saemankumensis TaxID=1447782 RepID=A0A1M6EQX9_9RHOB|nr:hypothetical protein SAMN05444417_2120 [Wenxinia saemankumensis]
MRAAFADQALSCDALGSPFMGRLMRLFAERDWPDGAVARRLARWEGDVTSRGQSVPLRIAGALHARVLQGDSALSAAYPPNAVPDDALWAAVAEALVREADRLDTWLDSPPQTNEVRRAAALIPVGHWLAARFGLPLTLWEMGASAGLNLMWDRFALRAGGVRLGPGDAALTLAPDWVGDLPAPAGPRIAARRGVDLNPLSPREDALRLTAYLWPDQPHRLALTRAAMAIAGAQVDRGDAGDWLADRLAGPAEGTCRMVFSTIAFQYFPARLQARIAADMDAAGARATDAAPLAWFGIEADGSGPGAALTLRLWPGEAAFALGRADFHGRWIDWRAPSPGP